jgi:hypothetical protein
MLGAGRAQGAAPSQSIDPAALGPVARTDQADFSSTNRVETGTIYTVPAGKRLVIEVVSGRAVVASGTKVRSTMVTRVASGSMNTHLTWTLQSVEGTHQIFALTHPIRLYADAGTKVDITTTRSTLANSGGITYSFSGYLINTP